MNNMKKVAEMLGVEFGEKFELIHNDKVAHGVFYFDEYGLRCKKAGRTVETQYDNDALRALLSGVWYEIEKLPWKPVKGDSYWRIDAKRVIEQTVWVNSIEDYTFYCAGNCFPSAKATQTHMSELIEELKENYKRGGK